MAKGCWVGTVGGNREIVGAYVGVDNVAHKVISGYVGDAAGKARLCYGKYNGFSFIDSGEMNPMLQVGGVAYGGGKAVAIGEDRYTGDRIARVYDGSSITDYVISEWSSTAQIFWRDIAYGNGLFVAVGVHSYNGQDFGDIAYSSDGKNWTKTSFQNKYWRCIAYGNGRFVVLGDTGGAVHAAYSTSGKSWTNVSSMPSTLTSVKRVVYGNNRFIATGLGINKFIYSTAGSSWSTVTTSTNKDSASDFAFGNGRYVSIGPDSYSGSGGNVWSSTCAYSDDNCATWTGFNPPETASWNRVVFGDAGFIAATDSKANFLIHSTDGAVWYKVPAPNAYWWCVVYGGGKYIAVTSVGKFAVWDC